jgi:hypothetical protein
MGMLNALARDGYRFDTEGSRAFFFGPRSGGHIPKHANRYGPNAQASRVKLAPLGTGLFFWTSLVLFRYPHLPTTTCIGFTSDWTVRASAVALPRGGYTQG